MPRVSSLKGWAEKHSEKKVVLVCVFIIINNIYICLKQQKSGTLNGAGTRVNSLGGYHLFLTPLQPKK